MIPRPGVRTLGAVLMATVVIVAARPVLAQPPAGGAGGMQMPDPKQMSGMPLPVADLQPGTVVVRVIRGSLANVIANQPVEILGADAPRTAKTNDAGRAEFAGLKPGTRVSAVTTVDGEKLQSQEFEVPVTGGVRLMLVATDPELEKKAAEDQKLAQAPAQAGIVVLGEQSRFVFELGDDSLTVFNILQILNTARTPVQPPQPVVIDLPEGAEGASMLDGSSPQAAVAAGRVTVKGPFPPGPTLVQYAYSMPYSGGDLSIVQRVPVALTRLSALAQKVGQMDMTSPQFSATRTVSSEGQVYVAAEGNAMKAGDAVTFNFTGLPHAPLWPRNLALAAALVILLAGTWASIRGRQVSPDADARRRKLLAKRDRLLGDLTTLEQQYRASAIEKTRYTERRGELIDALERIYRELDAEAAA
jgi:hypothetical protein